MIRNQLLFFFLLFTASATAQGFHIGVFGGASAYNGDLVEGFFPKKVTNGVLGLTGTYEFTDKISARAAFHYTMLGAADRYNKDPELRVRNLSFETKLYEFTLQGHYDFFSLSERKYTPFVMAGLGVIQFDPYIYYTGKQKIYLQPLGTEGQGLAGNPDMYGRIQLMIPFGGGIKYAINDNLRIGLEAHMRKTFTDYIDDVSTDYADPVALANARGQLAVDVAYRGDEITEGSPVYPSTDSQRGSPKAKDFYYFAGLHLTYRLTGGGGRFSGGSGGRSKLGCPTNIY